MPSTEKSKIIAVEYTAIKKNQNNQPFHFPLPAKTPWKTKKFTSKRTTNIRKGKHIHEHLRIAAKTRASFLKF